MKDLLPGAQHWPAIRDRDSERLAKQSSLEVRVAVAVVPGLFMTIGAAGRDQLVENGGHVLLKSGLELNRSEGGGASDVEHIHDPSGNSGGIHGRRDLTGDVMHISVSFGMQRNLVLKAHGWRSLLWSRSRLVRGVQVGHFVPIVRRKRNSPDVFRLVQFHAAVQGVGGSDIDDPGRGALIGEKDVNDN